MTATQQTEIKQRLLKECLRIQQQQIDTAKSAMDEAQESANEQQGSMEDKFESFREAMQIQRDMFAKQLAEAVNGLAMLKRIVVTKESKDAALGAVVITDSSKYFLALSLGEIDLDGEKYFAISPVSPLGKAMIGKKEKETFEFRDKKFKIKSIF